MQVRILELKIERLQSDLSRCKSERLGAEEVKLFVIWVYSKNCPYWFANNEFIDMTNRVVEEHKVVTAFRASQQTQEEKG